MNNAEKKAIQKKLEAKAFTFLTLFKIGDKFRFTNTADGRSVVYVITGVNCREFAYDFPNLNRIGSEVIYELKLQEGSADYVFPEIYRFLEERLAEIDDERSVLIEPEYKYIIEKL